jgi:hypothetical protein
MRDPQRVLSARPERSRVLPIIRTIRPRVLNESLSYLGELITTAHRMTRPKITARTSASAGQQPVGLRLVGHVIT